MRTERLFGRYGAVVLASVLAYLVLSIAMDLGPLSYGPVHGYHELRVFLSFLAVPVLFLAYRKDTNGIFGGWKAFAMNIGIYALFLPIMAMLFPPPGILESGVGAYALVCIPITLQVMSVDFFVRRVIQYPVSIGIGPAHGIGVGIGVWLLAHALELSVLGPIYGWWQMALLITVSAIVLAPAYAFTRDVCGQMAGHVMINLVFLALH